MTDNKSNAQKRPISGSQKKQIEVNLNALVQAVVTLREESSAAHDELAALQDDDSKIKALLNAMGDQIWFCDSDGDLIYANTAAYAWLQEEELGNPFMRWLAKLAFFTVEGVPRIPENAPLLRALHGEEIRGELERVKHPITGEIVYHEINAMPVKDVDGQLMGAVSDVRDVTKRFRAERQTQILNNLVITLSEVSSVPKVAEITLQQCMEIFIGAAGFVLLHSKDDQEAEVVAQVGLSENFSKTYHFSREVIRSSMADTAFTGAATWSETLLDFAAQFPDFYQEIADQIGLEAIFTLPLVVNHRVIGSIGIVFKEPTPFTQEERVFYQIVANYCAQALDRAQMHELAQAELLLKERQRFARDLHDSVTQSLYATRMMAEGLGKQKDSISSELLWERIEQLQRLSAGALAQMRNLLLEMRPEHWETISTKELLNQVANAAMGNTTLDVTVKIHEPLPDLSTATRTALYYITHEALNNIIKHAKAKHVTINLEPQGDQVQLSITDDGRGLDADQAKQGMGLGNMRERAEEIGAKFHIESLSTGGIQITVQINL